MGEVLQFRRAPQVQSDTNRAFTFKVDPSDLRWGRRDRGFYRISPDRDGTVVLEVQHAGGMVRLTLSVEDADTLRGDLATALHVAELQRQKARGALKWITAAVDGRDAFTVAFDDKTGTFVATKIRRPHPCEFCRAKMPDGSIMYRQEGKSLHRWRGGATAFPGGAILSDMGRRVCRACMAPPVVAADGTNP